jgi:hypothetical protein
MKKTFYLCISLAVALTFVSCGTQRMATSLGGVVGGKVVRGSNSSTPESGKDGSYVIPEQFETVPVLQIEQPTLPETL